MENIVKDIDLSNDETQLINHLKQDLIEGKIPEEFNDSLHETITLFIKLSNLITRLTNEGISIDVIPEEIMSLIARGNYLDKVIKLNQQYKEN